MSAIYPSQPGYKRAGTSQAAAEGMEPKAMNLRERVLAEVKQQPGTPESVARRLGVPLMNARPRFSELSAMGLIEDSGLRDVAAGGRQAIVWRAVR